MNFHEKNERCLLMDIFNNLNDVYLCITEYDNYICDSDKLCYVDNYKLMMSILNFSNVINTELNRIDRISKRQFELNRTDENKKRRIEFI
jgi:hypothetical protein